MDDDLREMIETYGAAHVNEVLRHVERLIVQLDEFFVKSALLMCRILQTSGINDIGLGEPTPHPCRCYDVTTATNRSPRSR
jgi:hypothetical protein